MAWNLSNPLGHDMHLDHGALQHICGAGLDCIPSTLLLLLLLLRAGCTSQAREEEDRRHGAVVTGIAVVWWFGIWESHEPVVSSFGVVVMLNRPNHVLSISMISDNGTCACRPRHGGGLEPVESTRP